MKYKSLSLLALALASSVPPAHAGEPLQRCFLSYYARWGVQYSVTEPGSSYAVPTDFRVEEIACAGREQTRARKEAELRPVFARYLFVGQAPMVLPGEHLTPVQEKVVQDLKDEFAQKGLAEAKLKLHVWSLLKSNGTMRIWTNWEGQIWADTGELDLTQNGAEDVCQTKVREFYPDYDFHLPLQTEWGHALDAGLEKIAQRSRQMWVVADGSWGPEVPGYGLFSSYATLCVATRHSSAQASMKTVVDQAIKVVEEHGGEVTVLPPVSPAGTQQPAL